MSKSQKKKDRKTGKSRGDSTYTAVNSQNPLAPRLMTKLKYTDSFVAALPAGPGFLDTVFMINSLFDPNFSAAGHQPKGYDQLVALYHRYRVFRVWYTVCIMPQSTGSFGHKLVCVATNETTALGGIDSAAEAYTSRQAYATLTNPGKVRGVIDLAELNGKTRAAYAADDTTAANSNASPSEQLALHCCVANFTGLAGNVVLDVNLVFEAEFNDPVQLGQS